MTGAAGTAHPAARLDLSRLLEPAGIAIVGASADPRRIGGQPLHCLATYGFPGRVYPVNPGHREIEGLPCYASVEAIPGPCDVALIAVPAQGVAEVVRQCGAKGVSYAVILSSGFAETGEAGRRMQAEIVRTAREAGVRLIGPNCQGLLNVPNRLFATFGAVCLEPQLRAGGVSMASQSGGFGFSVLLTCEALGLGFRAMVTTGNQADVDVTEVLDALVDDPGTRVLCAYIEAVADGRRLMHVAERALRAGKPLLVWKSGNTEAGARAALSHTASLAGTHAVYRGAFRQCGIIEVTDVHELADFAAALQSPVLPKGRRTAALGISAGACILFADEASACGLPLPPLSEGTAGALRGIVPAFGTIANPVDVTASLFNDLRLFTRAVDVVLADPGIDQLAVLMASLSGEPAAACCTALAAAMRRHGKPVLVAWSARRNRAAEAYRILEEAGIAVIASPVRLARAAAASCRFAEARAQLDAVDRALPPPCEVARPPAAAQAWNEQQSKARIASWGLSVTREEVARSPVGAREASRALRFPVVAKVLSRDLPHKSDAGGVRLRLPDAAAVEREVAAMLDEVARRAPEATIEGVLVAEMVEDGIEAILGVVHDGTFGPAVALGTGGVLAEIVRDVTWRVAPFGKAVALDMIRELRILPLLEGARGRPAADIDALAEAVVAISRGAWESRGRVLDVDVNPLFVLGTGRGVLAADALVLPAAAEGRP